MKAPKNPFSILVIEDNPADFFLIDSMLRSSPIPIGTICQATRIAEAYSLLEKGNIDLVLLDLSLPDSFGIASYLHIKSLVQHIPVIILSGHTESTIALKALQQGAQDYLVKGEFKADLLTRTIRYSIERKNAEEKILISEEKYRQMFYKNPFPAWIYEPDNLKILEVNDAAIQKYGYERKDFLALTIEDIRPPEEIPAMRQSIADRYQCQNWEDKVWKHLKKNGNIMLMEVTFYQIDYYGKVAMQAQMNDVTEKHRLEKELCDQRQEKQQQITQAILETQEEDRKTVAAELHDNINQILATAQLYLTTGSQHPDFAEMVSKGKECVLLAIDEIRKLTKSLVGPVFTSTGLKQAIESLATNIRDLKKINILTELDIVEKIDLSEALKLNLYRIVQEQLNNIVKYAQASEVIVEISGDKNSVVLLINDNGKGFDTSAQREGIGMINIRNRAELFNGKVTIDSAPGRGCSLKVKLKINMIMAQKAA